MLYKAGIIFSLVFIIGCTTTGRKENYYTDRNSKQLLRELVHTLPAQDTLEALLINEALLNQGAGAISDICGMLASDKKEDITHAQYALSGLSTYVSRTGLENQRQLFIEVIHKALNINMTKEQKAFLISQLQLSGDDRSVPYLLPFLADEDLCEPACQTLVSINSDAAGEALHSQLSNGRVKHKIILVKSIGDLRYRPAAGDIMTYTDDMDPETRFTALYALARIGYLPAREAFQQALTDTNSDLKNKIIPLYLLWAKQINDPDQCVLICREIIKDRDQTYEDHIKISALHHLVDLLGDKAIDDLQSFVENQNKNSRLAALKLAAKVGGETATASWIDWLPQTSPEIQSDIIDMLATRGDSQVLPTVLDFLKSEHTAVRLSAIKAGWMIGKEQAVLPLLDLLTDSRNPREHTAIKNGLLCLPGDQFIAELSARLEKMPVMAKITGLSILSERRATQSVDAILTRLNDDSVRVRIAAIKALQILAGPDEYELLLSHMLESTDPDEKKAAEDAFVTIASSIRDEQIKQKPIATSFDNTGIENQKYLLAVLKRLGGKVGLDRVMEEIKNVDPEIKDAALRTLVTWPEIRAIEPLIDLAHSDEELTYRVLAIRGCLRILEENELGIYQELAYYNDLFNAAERDEEKRLVLSGMASIRSVESLRAVSEYITDNSLSDEAAQLAISIASPSDNGDNNLSGNEVAFALIESLTNIDLSGMEQDSTQIPEGFIPLFNGEDLSGWKGLVENPVKRAQMSADELEMAQIEADKQMREHWKVFDGILCFDGQGQSLCTEKDYANFELLVDWRIEKTGDSGLYLRGSPQVQIWDPAGNPVGSGALYNNQIGASTPIKMADNPVGEWNTFRIIMTGSKVTVHLNDILVVNDVVMENYWERDKPIYPTGAIELQAHHSPLYFKNIYIRELPDSTPRIDGDLFNGIDLSGWRLIRAQTGSWKVDQGILYTEGEGGGWLSTEKEFGNFKLELEYRVPPGGNSGVFLRAPRLGDAAYAGMEIQVLDDYAQKYADLKPWQYTGSIYGVQAPGRRVSKPANQWQKMEIFCQGTIVQVTLNGELIIDTDLIEHMNKANNHPGLKRRKGYIGLQNHSSKIEYRNIRIKELD